MSHREPESKSRQNKIPPPIRTSSDLPLHSLDWERFQALCREVTISLPGTESCSVFGTLGQKQLGADLKGETATGGGIEIGQCKREQSFTKAKIRKASKEFLDHWENYWRPRNVKTFRLFVACELDNREIQEQLEEEREQFHALGIDYEPWPASRINSVLRRLRGLVTQYFGEGWADIMCDVPQAIAPPSDTSTLFSTIDQMASLLGGQAEGELELIRNAWREGCKKEAADRIEALCEQAPLWNALLPAAKAKILRFRAVVAIEREETLVSARAFAAEASVLAPDPQDTRLEALIANAERGAQHALSILADETDRDSLNLLASLQFFANLPLECETTLDQIATQGMEDAETHRIRALLKLVSRDLPAAQLAAQSALEIQPTWECTRIASAVVNTSVRLSLRSQLTTPILSWG